MERPVPEATTPDVCVPTCSKVSMSPPDKVYVLHLSVPSSPCPCPYRPHWPHFLPTTHIPCQFQQFPLRAPVSITLAKLKKTNEDQVVGEILTIARGEKRLNALKRLQLDQELIFFRGNIGSPNTMEGYHWCSERNVSLEVLCNEHYVLRLKEK